jgi:outer membrane protein TolC
LPRNSIFFGARIARLNQTVFDLVRIDNLHSATENLQTNLKAAKNARDLIVLAAAGTYLQLIATKARVIAATAQVTTARAIDEQTADRLAAGLSEKIDAMRARVQMQTEEQRLRSLRADFDTQKFRLARIIGLPLGQQFTIADEYHYAPLKDLKLDTALERAQHNRQDMQAAISALKAAEDALKAAHAERLPNLTVVADYEAAGWLAPWEMLSRVCRRC